MLCIWGLLIKSFGMSYETWKSADDIDHFILNLLSKNFWSLLSLLICIAEKVFEPFVEFQIICLTFLT